MERGWCSVDVAMSGTEFRFICSHLEVESLPLLQLAQADELMEVVNATAGPVILVGDFNADPLDRNGTKATYTRLTEELHDAWTSVFPQHRASGLTWGHDAALADPSDKLEWRIDLVLFKGVNLEPRGMQVIDMRLHQGQPPLWASDHAAVLAQFEVGKPPLMRGRAPRR